MPAAETSTRLLREGTADPLAACKARGRELAKAVLTIADGELEEVTGPIESRISVLGLPLAEPVPSKRALELAQGVPLDVGFKAFPDPLRDTNWIRALIRHYKQGIPFPTKVSDYVCTDEEFLVKELDERPPMVLIRPRCGEDWLSFGNIAETIQEGHRAAHKALEDIDAIVASRTVERRYDQVRHGEMLYGYKSFHLMSAARATGTPKMSRKIGSSSATE